MSLTCVARILLCACPNLPNMMYSTHFKSALCSGCLHSERRALPFFIYAYVDDEIIVARGRSGGLAVWAATTQEWEAKAGVLAVYK